MYNKEKHAFLGLSKLTNPIIGLGLTGAAGIAALAYYNSQRNKGRSGRSGERSGASKATISTLGSKDTLGKDAPTFSGAAMTPAEKHVKKVQNAEQIGRDIAQGAMGFGSSIYKGVLKPAFNKATEGYGKLWDAGKNLYNSNNGV